MRYFKIINNDVFVGVCTEDDFRRFQSRHKIIIFSSVNDAQYIQFNEELYHDNWMVPVSSDASNPYTEARVIIIEKDEYDTLSEAVEAGEEVTITEEQDNYEEVTEPADPADEVTVDYVKRMKIGHLSNICNQTIEAGFDVGGEHYSLTTQDQLNLITLSTQLTAGETAIPYHADGELCRFFTPEEVQAILTAATAHKTYQVTYFNGLKAYVQSLDNIADIQAVEYGQEIPEEFQSDVMKALLSQVM